METKYPLRLTHCIVLHISAKISIATIFSLTMYMRARAYTIWIKCWALFYSNRWVSVAQVCTRNQKKADENFAASLATMIQTDNNVNFQKMVKYKFTMQKDRSLALNAWNMLVNDKMNDMMAATSSHFVLFMSQDACIILLDIFKCRFIECTIINMTNSYVFTCLIIFSAN